MKQKIINIFMIIILLYLLFNIITDKTLIYNTIKYSTNIWFNNLVPSLFPMFIISELLIKYNFGYYITAYLNKYLNKILGISGNNILLLILAILSGFPSSAKNIKTMYNNNEIDENEASILLTFTHFSNPIFIISTITSFLNNNITLSIIILISHYLGNFIILLFVRKKLNNKQIIFNKSIYLSSVLITSINNAINTLLLILGTITFFSLITNIITSNLNLSIQTNLLIKGLLEITQGLEMLGHLNINNIYKVIIASMFLSFGGFCIHLQVISQIIDTKISYQKFLVARIFHSIISGIIAFITYSLYFSLFA